MPLTPEEIAAASEDIDAVIASISGRTPTGKVDLGVPQVPEQRQADVAGAALDLQRQATDYYSQSTPGPEAVASARSLVDLVRGGAPRPSAPPTIAQSVTHALTPHVQEDAGAVSVADQIVAAARNAPTLAAQVMTPGIHLSNFLGSNLADAAGLEYQKLPTPEDYLPEAWRGAPTENGALYLMRTVFTAAPAFIQQTMGRVPAPDLSRLVAGVKEGSGAEVYQALGPGRSSMSKEITGTDVRDTQVIHRGNPVMDWAQGWAEQVDRGGGLEDMYQAGFARRGWDPRLGYGFGLVVDAFTDWEGGMVKVPEMMGNVARRAGAMKALAPIGIDLAENSRIWAALRGATAEWGEHLGGKMGAEMEAGRATIDNLPPSWRARLDEVTLANDGMTAEELTRLDGVGAPKAKEGRVVDPEFMRQQQELEAAKKAYGSGGGTVAPDPPVPVVPPEEAQAWEASRQQLQQYVTRRQAALTTATRDAVAAEQVAGQRATAIAASEPHRVAQRELLAAGVRREAILKDIRDLGAPEGAELENLKGWIGDREGQGGKLIPQVQVWPPRIPAYAGFWQLVDRLSAGRLIEGKQTVGGESVRRYFLELVEELEGALPAAESKAQKAAASAERKAWPAASRDAAAAQTSAAAKRLKAATADLAEAQARLEAHVATPPEARLPVEDAALAAADRPTRRRGLNRAPDERPVVPPIFGEAQGRGINVATEYWDGLTKWAAEHPQPGGYKLPTGDGFARFADAAEQVPDSPKYFLRNSVGDVIVEGTLRDVLHGPKTAPKKGMLSRQFDGDEVWYDWRRPVARWSKTVDEAGGSVKLVTDYHMGSPAEAGLVGQLRKSDPRAVLGKLRTLGEADGANAMGRFLADAMSDSPTTTPGTSVVTQRLQEALGLEVRSKMGTSELVPLPNGAWVSARDRQDILGRVADALPFSTDRARQILQKGQAITEAEAAKLAEALAAVGLDPARPLDPELWTDLRRALTTTVGGVFADTRYRVQGTPAFVDRLFAGLRDSHLKKTVEPRWLKAVFDRAPVQWIAKGLLEDRMASLPDGVRYGLKQMKVRLERVPEEVLHDIRKIVPRTKSDPKLMVGALLEILGRYQAVHPERLAAAERVLAGEGRQAIQAELQASWRGPRPGWLDATDPRVVAAGIGNWSRMMRQDGAALGRRWVESVLLAGGRNPRGTTLGDAIRERPIDEMLAVYRELYLAGTTDGPGLRKALGKLGIADFEFDVSRALVLHAAQEKAQGIVSETMEQLVREGTVVRGGDVRALDRQAGDVGRSVLDAVAEGVHRWKDSSGRWTYGYPDSQVTWALGVLRDWGIDPGAGAALKRTRIGGQEVVIPEYLAEEFRRLTNLGIVDSRGLGGDFWGSRAFSSVMRYFKEWTTHGLILPRPAYFVGQMMGTIPIMTVSVGPAQTASALTQVFRHPIMVGELMMRLADREMPLFQNLLPDAHLLRTASGDLISVDQLFDGAKRAALQDTHASYETAERLIDVMGRTGGWKGLPDLRNLKPVAALGWWQNLLREAAGGFDMAARVSLYVDLVQQGEPIERAASIARQSLLDFRDLTEFERKYARVAVTFYAFMRKNSDAFMRATVQHPGRVGLLARTAHESLTQQFDPLALGQMSDQDTGRLTVWSTDGVVNDQGRVDPRYAHLRYATTPIGVAEWLGMMRMMTVPFTDRPPGGENPLGSLTPLLQTAAIWSMGRKLDREFGSTRANRITPWMMHGPMATFTREAFDVGAVALGPEDDPLQADPDATHLLNGKPAVWVAGAGSPANPDAGRKAWQSFMVWFASPTAQVQQLLEASPLPDGISVPADETQSNASLAYLTGLKARAIPTEAEAARKHQLDVERRLRSTAHEVAVPLPAPR